MTHQPSAREMAWDSLPWRYRACFTMAEKDDFEERIEALIQEAHQRGAEEMKKMAINKAHDIAGEEMCKHQRSCFEVAEAIRSLPLPGEK